MRSSPGPGFYTQARVRQHYNSRSLASLQAEAATARTEISGIATPCSKHAGKEAEAGLGNWKKLIEGNIGDWKLLKKMEINE